MGEGASLSGDNYEYERLERQAEYSDRHRVPMPEEIYKTLTHRTIESQTLEATLAKAIGHLRRNLASLVDDFQVDETQTLRELFTSLRVAPVVVPKDLDDATIENSEFIQSELAIHELLGLVVGNSLSVERLLNSYLESRQELAKLKEDIWSKFRKKNRHLGLPEDGAILFGLEDGSEFVFKAPTKSPIANSFDSNLTINKMRSWRLFENTR